MWSCEPSDLSQSSYTTLYCRIVVTWMGMQLTRQCKAVRSSSGSWPHHPLEMWNWKVDLALTTTQHNSLSVHVKMHYACSTTHSTAFCNPPMHATNTRHSGKNGTRCREDICVHTQVFKARKSIMLNVYDSHKKVFNWKQAHVGMEPSNPNQTR